jgi:hypothetical protein
MVRQGLSGQVLIPGHVLAYPKILAPKLNQWAPKDGNHGANLVAIPLRLCDRCLGSLRLNPGRKAGYDSVCVGPPCDGGR